MDVDRACAIISLRSSVLNMISKLQLQRHVSARPHARTCRPEILTEPGELKDRVRSCLSQDRFEAFSEHGIALPQDEPGALLPSEDTAERWRLLTAVSEESNVIRAGLDLCGRIAKALA